jgi:hypothetical protein
VVRKAIRQLTEAILAWLEREKDGELPAWLEREKDGKL